MFMALMHTPPRWLRARAPPVKLSANVHVANLLDALAASAEHAMLEEIKALEATWKSDKNELDGLDFDPSGTWMLLSFDSLARRFSEMSIPFSSSNNAIGEVQISSGGPAQFQNDCCIAASVQPRSDDADEVHLSWGGVVALGESDVSVVLLRADMSTPPGASNPCPDASMDLVEAALEPHLPPGAIRAKLQLAWIDEEVCILREGSGGVVVLRRLFATNEEALVVGGVAESPVEDGEEEEAQDTEEEAAEASAEDPAEDERELWVGSPY